ncbi:MAG: amidohydrolase family protein [Proteobacteria bacterium]|jgi:5-methylthioadenosine/S-adenosylhomocysteine deaminase|nr:amidohydrolase family protein [Pseudomonadota bacterium]
MPHSWTTGPRSVPEQVDLLITVDVLYPMDGINDVVVGAEIAIREGILVHAGPTLPAGSWTPTRRIDGSGKAALPGFVNCHCHTASTVFRTQTDDNLGGGALYSVAFRGEARVSPDDWRRLAVLGVVEMIRAGITTLNDFWYCPDAMGEAALATGLRMQLATEIVDVDKALIGNGDYMRDHRIGERTLRDGIGAAERWHGAGDGLITARLGPHATDTCSAGLHREAAIEARRRGIGLHCHVAQSRTEVAAIRAWHGVGPGVWLSELGVLGPDCVLAHLTYADADDLRVIAASGAKAAHAACIYPRRGANNDLLGQRAAGVSVGLATDWMLNDPFEAMRTALGVARMSAGRHDALTSLQALELATASAAEVMGLGDRIGRLTPGREADMILVDLDRPHLQPFYAEPASLVWYARPEDVVTSIVRGRVVMEDRRILGLDENAALAEVKARTPHLAEQMRALGGVARISGCPCGAH